MDENFDVTRMSRVPAVPLEEYGRVKTWVLTLAAVLISFGLIPIVMMVINQGDPVGASNKDISATEFYLGVWLVFALPVFIGLMIAALNIHVRSRTLAEEHGIAVGITVYGLLMAAVPLFTILIFGHPW